MRDGEIDAALDAYQAHDRIISAPTATQTRQTMVADWWAARLAGHRTLMVAARWHDVDDLNAGARRHVEAHSILSGPVIEINGRPYQTGDEIMTLRNQRRLGVRNGDVGVITAVDADTACSHDPHRTRSTRSRPITSTPDTSATRTRTTIHKAQGLTVDSALVLGDDSLYQEAGYVALSRGRAQNRLYLVGRSPDEEHHRPRRTITRRAARGPRSRQPHAGTRELLDG